MRNRAGRPLQWAGLVIGIAAIALQFAISVPASIAAGRSVVGSLVWFFSFFTILTNILAVLVHAAALRSSAGLLGRAPARGCVAASMALVMIVYHFLLAGLWAPQGLFLLCDVALHYVTPILYLCWWGLAGSDGTLRWSDPARWLAYPLAYTAWALGRGAVAGEVPYPFLALDRGVAALAVNIAAIAALFLVLGLAVVLADHLFNRTGSPA